MASADPWASYAGKPLASRTRYYWSVRVWTGSEGADRAGRSPPGSRRRYLSADEWRGQWIAGPERASVGSAAEGEADDAEIRAAGEFCRPVGWLTSGFAAARSKNDQGECRELRPAPMLRRSFTLDKPVRSARVYASGLAYDALRVNGSAVSDSVLDPGFTDYSQTVLYTTHDVTALLRQGENVIASVLGSGHFDDATRTWDWGWEKAQWRGVPRLRLDLHVTYADGSEHARPLGRQLEGQRGRADPLRQLLPRRDLRRAPRARRTGTGPASTTRAGRRHGWWRRRRARCARRCRSRSVSSTRGRRARAASRRPASSSTTPARTSPAGPRSA